MASVNPKIPFLRQSSSFYSPSKQQPPRFTFDFSAEDLKSHTQNYESVSPGGSKGSPDDDQKHRNSPTASSPKNGFSSTGHLNVDLKRLKSGYLDDEVVYAALQKLNVILKQQQEKKLKASNPEYDEENNGNQSPFVKKNKELMRRIQKFQNAKGMMPKNKEKTFESKIGPFKRLNTFVNIHGVLKDLSDPATLASPLHSGVNTNSPKAATPQDGGFRGFVKTPSRFSEAKTPSSPSPFHLKLGDITISPPDTLKKPATSSFRLGIKLQPINTKEEGPDMQQLVEDNMKKHMGVEAFEAIQVALLDPRKQREVKAKNRAEIEKMRQTKENLRNNNLFHSLIDYLAVQNKPQAPKLIEDEDGPSPSPFYQKLERVLNQDNNRSGRSLTDLDGVGQQVDQAAELDMYKQALIQKLQASISPAKVENKKFTLKIQTRETPEEAANDEQVKAATLLNSYRERSKKILDILKKKNAVLHNKGIRTGRVEKNQTEHQSSRFSQFLKPLNATTALTKVRSSGAAEEDNRTFELTSVGRESGEENFTKRVFQVMGTSPSEPSMHHFSNISMNIKNREKFNRKILANRRQFTTNLTQKRSEQDYGSEMIDKRDSNNDSSLQSSHFVPRRCCTKIKERSTGLKGTKSQFFYEHTSVEDIQGQLSSLSTSNRQIQTELKDSTKEMKTFYNTKISSMKTAEIPESLRISTELIDSTTKKASLIIKLTKRVLRDQIL